MRLLITGVKRLLLEDRSLVDVFFDGARGRESEFNSFLTALGLFKWKRLPKGLASAPVVFQNPTDLIFAVLF